MRETERCDVLVIGGGPSGMMAAICAAERGRKVLIAEQNEKLGKKLFITGKGRCNLTNACEESELFDHISSNHKFLFSSIKRFSNTDVMNFFEGLGVKLKIERGGRVFPSSDHSSDIIRALEKRLRELNVEIRLGTRAEELLIDNSGLHKESECRGALVTEKGQAKSRIYAESVICASGGLSYPATGSTGDGLRFARLAGIKVKDAFPSLVPLEIKGNICERLQGLSLKNVKIRINEDSNIIYESFEPGEMLFTHFGVSGPMILTATSDIAPLFFDRDLTLHIDFKPALSLEELDDRILRDFKENMNKEFKNSLNRLLPSKLIPIIIELSGIEPSRKVNLITSAEHGRLVRLMKDFVMDIAGTRGFDEAIITKGGVDVSEIDPKTFESKRVRGLYFAGEVIDVDAHTGGFNLQIAWSTGHAAGSYA